jgi:hypothetical protein
MGRVLKATKQSREAVAKLLGVPEDRAIAIIEDYMIMSPEEFKLVCDLNTVCFWTASAYCAKGDQCPKEKCGSRHYPFIKRTILATMTGITKFAKHMHYCDNELELVPRHFGVQPEDVPALAKYLAEKSNE